MTHDDIIKHFGRNKVAVEALGFSKASISKARYGRPSTQLQIRAFHLSNGALAMDEEAEKYFNFLTGKPVQAETSSEAA